jgi:hypothetical protein
MTTAAARRDPTTEAFDRDTGQGSAANRTATSRKT